MSRSGEADDGITIAKSGETAASLPEHRREERSESCRTERVAMSSIPELSPVAIDTDVRRRGINPFLTGVTAGIIAFLIVFLLGFVYFVVSYLRY
jgi:hypothetical protein